MALAADVGFGDVAQLDGPSFSALERALERRWTVSDELLATLCELVHWLARIQIARGGKRPPPPWTVERPTRARDERRGGVELLALLGGRVSG